MVAPLVQTASASGVLKSSSSAPANRSQAPSGAGSEGERNTSRKRSARRSPRARVLDEVERLPPVPRREEEEHVSRPPLVEGVLQRDVVADRLVHLLAAELEHPVVHPELGERPPGARLGDLVLVVREDEVEPAAVDLEVGAEVLSDMAEHSMCQPGPAAPTASPTRCPRPACSPFHARSRAGSPLRGFGSCSSTLSGRCPERRP